VVFEGSGGAFCGRPSNARGCVNSEAKLLRAEHRKGGHYYFSGSGRLVLALEKQALLCVSGCSGRTTTTHLPAGTRRRQQAPHSRHILPRAALLHPLYSLRFALHIFSESSRLNRRPTLIKDLESQTRTSKQGRRPATNEIATGYISLLGGEAVQEKGARKKGVTARPQQTEKGENQVGRTDIKSISAAGASRWATASDS
jgi:hypothetical protein